MLELSPQGFFPNHKGQEQKQNLNMASHGITGQHCMWDTLQDLHGLAWDQSQIWTPVLQNPRYGWFCTLGKAEVAHHTHWEVQSYHALSCLCTASPSPKDSQYSSVPFFVAAGYKTLVIPETTQIQCLNPETTIMKITDLQSKAANRSTTQWMLLGGEVSLWKSTNCS